MSKRTAMNTSRAMVLALFMPTVAVLAQGEGEDSEVAVGDGPGATAPQVHLAIQLGAPFCDGMVLQRDMKVPVWGWSKPGSTIIVAFNGQNQSAVAGVAPIREFEVTSVYAQLHPIEKATGSWKRGSYAIQDWRDATGLIEQLMQTALDKSCPVR